MMSQNWFLPTTMLALGYSTDMIGLAIRICYQQHCEIHVIGATSIKAIAGCPDESFYLRRRHARESQSCQTALATNTFESPFALS